MFFFPSVAWQKQPDLLCSFYQPTVSSCDVLVVPVGHSSMSRAINVVQKLWSNGVSTDIAYDVSQVSGLPVELHLLSARFYCGRGLKITFEISETSGLNLI